MTFGISQGEAHTRVGYSAYEVGLGVVFFAEHLSASFAHVFGVDALVVAGWESVIDPEERTYLAAS